MRTPDASNARAARYRASRDRSAGQQAPPGAALVSISRGVTPREAPSPAGPQRREPERVQRRNADEAGSSPVWGTPAAIRAARRLEIAMTDMQRQARRHEIALLAITEAGRTPYSRMAARCGSAMALDDLEAYYRRLVALRRIGVADRAKLGLS